MQPSAPPPPPPPPPARGRDPVDTGLRFVGCMVAVKACLTILTGLLTAVVSSFALAPLRAAAESEHVALDGVTLFIFNNPHVITLCALGAVACGIWLLVTQRLRWMMLTLSTLCLIGALVLLLWTLVGVLRPLYTLTP